MRRRRLTGDLSCRELVEVLTDYLEGSLPREERARVEGHLRSCDGCDAYVAQMRTTIRLAGRLTEESLAPPAREALLVAFRGYRPGSGEA